jgi:hypothetical protein
MFDRLWNERGIMNMLTLISSLKKLQPDYILANYPFLVDASSNKTAMWVVLPDKQHELLETYSDRKSNLHGYMLKVSMFNDRPTAVLQYDKLTGRLIGKRRNDRVLDIITKCVNFAPVNIKPRHKQKAVIK